MAKSASVLDVFDQLKIEDVAAELAAAEAELAEAVAAHQKRVGSLRELRKVLTIRRDGKPPRAARGTGKKAARANAEPAGQQHESHGKSGAGGRGEAAEKIATHLRLYGRMTAAELAKGVGIPYATVYGNLTNNPSRFKKHEDGRYGVL